MEECNFSGAVVACTVASQMPNEETKKKTAVGNLGGGGVTGPAALLALFIEYQVLLMVGGA